MVYSLRGIYNDALLKLVKEHVSGVVSHEIHVEEAKTRTYSGMINAQERLFVINSRILRKPRVKVLH